MESPPPIWLSGLGFVSSTPPIPCAFGLPPMGGLWRLSRSRVEEESDEYSYGRGPFLWDGPGSTVDLFRNIYRIGPPCLKATHKR